MTYIKVIKTQNKYNQSISINLKWDEKNSYKNDSSTKTLD